MKLVKEHINEKFEEDSDPVHDMGIGITGLWDYSPEEAAEEIWAVSKEQVSKLVNQAKRTGRTYHLVPGAVVNYGCEKLSFNPNAKIKFDLAQLVQKEINKAINNHLLTINSNVKYLQYF